MRLPVMPFVAPMLATAASSLPLADDEADGPLAYEPKWDGFRTIIFRDRDDVIVSSRDGKDLTYCFPEVEAFARDLLPPRCVVDGELIIVTDSRLDFEALGSRIRPKKEAGGRSIAALAEQSPAQLVAFDLLALGDEDLMSRPYSYRRDQLELALVNAETPVRLTPMTRDSTVAADWFVRYEGAGLDGLVCKKLDSPYSPGKRTMIKVKHQRTADVVVAAWREHKTTAPDGSALLGSLLLGAYDDEGRLHHLGVCASFTASRRAELAAEMSTLEVDSHADHPWLTPTEGTRIPGGVSRWTGSRDLSFRPVRPERVVEVRYDQLQGERFRHTAHFTRWRPDRDPTSCTYAQFEQPAEIPLSDVLGLD